MGIFAKFRAKFFPPINQKKAVVLAIQAVLDQQKRFLEIAGNTKVYSQCPSNCRIYNMPKEPCWFVFVPEEGGPSVGSSRVILVSKLTGKVLYDGRAGDEG